MSLRALLVLTTLAASGAAHACTPIPPGSIPPSRDLLHNSTKVYLGKLRDIRPWDREEWVYYAIVEVRETLKGPPAEVVGAFIFRAHCRPGHCPCARLGRPGDAVIARQWRLPDNPSEHVPLIAESVDDLGSHYVSGLRAFARESPEYRPAPRERPEWWRGAGQAIPTVRD